MRSLNMKRISVLILTAALLTYCTVNTGDSIESLYNAYNGNRGTERSAQGDVLASDDYGESGSIVYHFADNSLNYVIS